MTDRDVVERVAAAFGTSVTSLTRPNRRVLHTARLKGHRAALLMRDLAPIMSERRRTAVAAAVSFYPGRRRKLDFEAAERIRDLRTEGASVSSLARAYGVARVTVRQVCDRSIYKAPTVVPWRVWESPAAMGKQLQGAISPCELLWLAGWLEGEGSFLAPPPSDPRRPRIVARTRDGDVAAEVARLLRVTPLFSHDERERRRGWSPTWRVLKRGRGAATMMEALYPRMGSRRRSQIESALEAVRLRDKPRQVCARCVSGGGGNCTRVRGRVPM